MNGPKKFRINRNFCGVSRTSCLALSFLRRQESRAPAHFGKKIAHLHTDFMTGMYRTKKPQCASYWKDHGHHTSDWLLSIRALDPCLRRDDDDEQYFLIRTMQNYEFTIHNYPKSLLTTHSTKIATDPSFSEVAHSCRKPGRCPVMKHVCR